MSYVDVRHSKLSDTKYQIRLHNSLHLFNSQKINWVYQDEQLGTAHALKQALPMIDNSKLDSLLVLYGDVPLV